jgi:hypothetical protein
MDNVLKYTYFIGKVDDSIPPNYTKVNGQHQALATLTPFKKSPGRQWMRSYVLLNTEAPREDGCEDQ